MTLAKTTAHPGWSGRGRLLPSVEWARAGLLAAALGICVGFWAGVALALQALL